MKFKLEIEIGNDAILNYSDINDVLARVGTRLANWYGPISPVLKDTGNIGDQNGNTVGLWRVTK